MIVVQLWSNEKTEKGQIQQHVLKNMYCTVEEVVL